MADQQHRAQAAEAQQSGGFASILESVVRQGFDQQGRFWDTAAERFLAHVFCFWDRPGAAARKHEQWSGAFPI